MQRIEKKSPSEMTMSELENEYISSMKSRTGGIIMICFTVPFIVLCWWIQFTIGYWFFAICLLIWSIMTYSIHDDVIQLREQLKIRFGVDND